MQHKVAAISFTALLHFGWKFPLKRETASLQNACDTEEACWIIIIAIKRLQEPTLGLPLQQESDEAPPGSIKTVV